MCFGSVPLVQCISCSFYSRLFGLPRRKRGWGFLCVKVFLLVILFTNTFFHCIEIWPKLELLKQVVWVHLTAPYPQASRAKGCSLFLSTETRKKQSVMELINYVSRFKARKTRTARYAKIAHTKVLKKRLKQTNCTALHGGFEQNV